MLYLKSKVQQERFHFIAVWLKIANKGAPFIFKTFDLEIEKKKNSALLDK